MKCGIGCLHLWCSSHRHETEAAAGRVGGKERAQQAAAVSLHLFLVLTQVNTDLNQPLCFIDRSQGQTDQDAATATSLAAGDNGDDDEAALAADAAAAGTGLAPGDLRNLRPLRRRLGAFATAAGAGPCPARRALERVPLPVGRTRDGSGAWRARYGRAPGSAIDYTIGRTYL